VDPMELLPIGDLARRTGLTVKAVRYYADHGIVPPDGRSPAGYRRWSPSAVARLELVRTLRELGLDLATIRRVVHREATLTEVAAAHAEALAVQIRALRLHQAVLSAAARLGSDPAQLTRLRSLAELSARERRALIDDFIGGVFAGLPDFDGIARSLTPELPDEPSPAQIEAWIELAELTRDPDFRELLRRLAAGYAADRDYGVPRPDVVASVLAAGSSVAEVLDRFPVRERVITQLEAARDPRHERYRELLSVVNGWAAPERLAPALDQFLTALTTNAPGN
jgi:DNA-binding transcriptional MerR regulator